ncbi:NACHT domain-containing protein [Parasphingorhabdus sp.]|uniref:NACHT domain-containing protein n=1 Tax=Parasphingorhabdus sp. TaxID=2709688 RepID=UPI003D29ED01
MSVVGTVAAEKAANLALNDMLQKLSPEVEGVKRSILDKAAVALRIGFEDYLQITYRKCRYYKTLLNPYEPADLQSSYIDLKLKRDDEEEEEIPDTTMFNDVRNGKPTIITGLAGSGKSMLMRYFALNCFQNHSEGIPLFIELRSINDQKKKDIVGLILKECQPNETHVTERQLELSFKAGLFVIILDGFDEVDYEIRNEVSKQIQDLVLKYPKMKIVLSSRPDDERFSAWKNFNILEVKKFTIEQTKSLVNVSRYDTGVKERFINAIDQKFTESQKEFLESPLLSLIMLLTYEEFAEIPNKMHSFYARAFDTLFQKHDADKEQFVRKIKTGLPKEDFKLIFSAFCAMSYLEQKFTFNEAQMKQTASRAIAYASQISSEVKTVSPDDFVKDLKDAVCMVYLDGLVYSFVHRSFQEYFAAVFLEKFHGENIFDLINNYSKRLNDNVITMAIDMAREKLEEEWVKPTIENYKAEFFSKEVSKNIANLLKSLFGPIRVYRHKQMIWISVSKLNEEKFGPLFALCRCYPAEVGSDLMVRDLNDIKFDKFKKNVLNKKHKGKKRYAEFAKSLATASDEDSFISVKAELTVRDNWWLNEIGFVESFDLLGKRLDILYDEICKRESKRKEIMNAFL